MDAHDEVSERDADLIRAAEAAASWAHARRATWTDTRLGAVATAPPVATPEAGIDLIPETMPAPDTALPELGHSHPSVAVRIATAARELGLPAIRWPAVAAVAALGIASVVGVPYLKRALQPSTISAPAAEPTAPRPAGARPPATSPTTARPPATSPSAVATRPTGALRVNSTPAGARVIVDGRARGVTPLTLTDLTPGQHDVALESEAGNVRRNVTVAANATAEMDESIFSGWVAVYAPFEVVIAEGGRVLRTDERGQIMLRPGIHELRVTNKTLAYDSVQSVEVKPGETTNLQVTPASSTLTVRASEAAEVWLDGVRVGETPVNAVPVPLGTHDLLLKRATGGERRFSITVGVNPYTLNVDFQRP